MDGKSSMRRLGGRRLTVTATVTVTVTEHDHGRRKAAKRHRRDKIHQPTTRLRVRGRKRYAEQRRAVGCILDLGDPLRPIPSHPNLPESGRIDALGRLSGPILQHSGNNLVDGRRQRRAQTGFAEAQQRRARNWRRLREVPARGPRGP